MLRIEAYDKMVEGYCVKHPSFGKDEFLWMDKDMIIRDEHGNEFETDFDNKDPMWQSDWSIYKGKAVITPANGKSYNLDIQRKDKPKFQGYESDNDLLKMPSLIIGNISYPARDSKNFDSCDEIGMDTPSADDVNTYYLSQNDDTDPVIVSESSAKRMLETSEYSTQVYIHKKKTTKECIIYAFNVIIGIIIIVLLVLGLIYIL